MQSEVRGKRWGESLVHRGAIVRDNVGFESPRFALIYGISLNQSFSSIGVDAFPNKAHLSVKWLAQPLHGDTDSAPLMLKISRVVWRQCVCSLFGRVKPYCVGLRVNESKLMAERG